MGRQPAGRRTCEGNLLRSLQPFLAPQYCVDMSCAAGDAEYHHVEHADKDGKLKSARWASDLPWRDSGPRSADRLIVSEGRGAVAGGSTTSTWFSRAVEIGSPSFRVRYCVGASGVPTPAQRCRHKRWLALPVKAAYFSCRAHLRLLFQRPHGRIVNQTQLLDSSELDAWMTPWLRVHCLSHLDRRSR